LILHPADRIAPSALHAAAILVHASDEFVPLRAWLGTSASHDADARRGTAVALRVAGAGARERVTAERRSSGTVAVVVFPAETATSYREV
jgi:hypothetical protein